MEQYREGTFPPFFLFLFPFHFCCGHCLYLPRLAGVHIGTVSCVCKFLSFSTVSGCSSTLVEHWQSLSWKSNHQTNWVYWAHVVTTSGSPLSQSILRLPVPTLVSHLVQHLHRCPQHTTRVWVNAFTRQWIYLKYCHLHRRAEEGRHQSGY